MIYGSAQELEGFTELARWFAPFYELGTGVHEIGTKRRQWLACPLSEIDPDEVD